MKVWENDLIQGEILKIILGTGVVKFTEILNAVL